VVALRLSSHPGAGGPTQPLCPLPLLSLPAPVVRSVRVRGRQENHGALGAFPHRGPRTSRRPHSGALRGCSSDRPPCGHGCGRWGGRPTEHVESLCVCEGAIPAVQSPAHSGLACALLARGGTNAGQRVPTRRPEVRSGEAELPPGVWPSRQRLGLALASTPVGCRPTRRATEAWRTAADGAPVYCNVARSTAEWNLIDDGWLHDVVIAPPLRAVPTLARRGRPLPCPDIARIESSMPLRPNANQRSRKV